MLDHLSRAVGESGVIANGAAVPTQIRGADSFTTLESAQKEIEKLRHEQARLLELRSEVMQLIGTEQPERLLHDLRNILNERELLRALAGA